MDFSDYTFLINHQLLIAAGLGALIGFERELSGKDPSLRTFALICLGSCVFSMLSRFSADGIANAEPSRIAAQILPGIGFIGAGAIFKSQRGIAGLTTAALMWVTAAIGMAVGWEKYEWAVSTTITALAITILLKLVHKIVRIFRKVEPTNTLT